MYLQSHLIFGLVTKDVTVLGLSNLEHGLGVVEEKEGNNRRIRSLWLLSSEGTGGLAHSAK